MKKISESISKALWVVGFFSLVGAGWYAFPWEEDTFYYAALGDSGTTAFNAEQDWNNKDYSWATGTKVNSHYMRLKKHHPKIKVINMAIPGVKSDDLVRQAEQASIVKLDYVTILIGANDFCGGKADPEQYGDNIMKAIRVIQKKSPNAKILLSSLPNIPKVRAIAETMTCGLIWREAMKHCDVSDTNKFLNAWVGMNFELAKISMTSGNVRYSSSLSSREITKEGISNVDCFHPNNVGQEAIADMTWNDGFFKDER